MNYDHSVIEVHVSVAVSESGREKCHIANSNWLQEQGDYQRWLKELRHDKQLWSVKTFKVKLPMPLSFEYADTSEAAKQGGAQ